MGPADAAAPGADDRAETTELDPAGVLTRSVEPGTGFIPVQPAEPGPPAGVQSVTPAVSRPRRQRRAESPYRWWPGAVALAFAGALIVVDAVAVSQAGAGSFAGATALAWAAIAISIIAVLAGAAAIVLGRGRVAGVVAVVVGIGANPYLLTRVLEVLGG